MKTKEEVQLFKIQKKLEIIIATCVQYQRTEVLRKIKHTKAKKLMFYSTSGDNISVWWGAVKLMEVSGRSVFNPRLDYTSRMIGGVIVKVKRSEPYSTEELFDLHLQYSTDIVQQMQIHNRINAQKRFLEIFSLEWDLICEASAACRTQYYKLDRSVFDVCSF